MLASSSVALPRSHSVRLHLTVPRSSSTSREHNDVDAFLENSQVWVLSKFWVSVLWLVFLLYTIVTFSKHTTTRWLSFFDLSYFFISIRVASSTFRFWNVLLVHLILISLSTPFFCWSLSRTSSYLLAWKHIVYEFYRFEGLSEDSLWAFGLARKFGSDFIYFGYSEAISENILYML